METWDAIRSRRNVRDYRPDPIPDADLLRIAEAGWRKSHTRLNERLVARYVEEVAFRRPLSKDYLWPTKLW